MTERRVAARQPRASTPDRAYDPTTIRLHWATAVLVTLLWGIGQAIDLFPAGVERMNVRSVHIVLGFALACVLAWRLWWRAARRRRLDREPGGARLAASKAIHASLYLLLVGEVVLGLLNAWARGDTVFGWFKISPLIVTGMDLRHRIGDLHAVGANTLLAVAGLHAAAALVHHYILRDGTLARMLPRRVLR
ncbi:MAG: cytochrome b [Ramlibacter sp.]